MYSFESRVRYSECDAEERLTLVSLVNYLQDCSTFHTQELGHGVAYLRERHVAWFIAAWQIAIDRLPRFCDPIVVSTWCHEATRTMAGRNFVIAAPDGTPYVRADSLWFTFDTAARRPVRIPDHERVYLEDTPRLDLPPTERRLRVDGPFVEATPVTMTTHHLDTNGHVNNAQYISLAVDALSDVGAAIDVAALRRVCVQYRQMALAGDVVVPRVHDGMGARVVDLAAPDGPSFAVVRLEERDGGDVHAVA